jgi:hypothetical protein
MIAIMGSPVVVLRYSMKSAAKQVKIHGSEFSVAVVAVVAAVAVMSVSVMGVLASVVGSVLINGDVEVALGAVGVLKKRRGEERNPIEEK